MEDYYIWTIGCQMNVADSERLESALEQMGLGKAASAKEADVVVLNSCVVRQSAEDKVVGMLGHLKPMKQQDGEKVVALMGCMVGPKTDTLHQRFPQVDVFMRPQQFTPLIDLLGDRMGIDPEGCVGPLTARPNVTAYVPIIHGCDKFCTFCIIPYRRGREVSRTIPDIVREVELLADRGVREVTLLGQNVDSYGHDLDGDVDLGHLLKAVHPIDGVERIRFLTSHPNDMSDHIIEHGCRATQGLRAHQSAVPSGRRRCAFEDAARVHEHRLPQARRQDTRPDSERVHDDRPDCGFLWRDGRAVQQDV